MKVGAIAPWFGAKRNMASLIVEALGPHRVYWEPFCGSLAVLLAKPLCVMETVNDLHGDLVNLARIVRDPFDAPRLYRRLRRTLVFDQVAEDSRAALETETDPFERAYHYFVESWLGRNGVSGTQSTNNGFSVRFTSNGGNPAVRFRSAVGSIPHWHKRLSRVVITRRDAFWLLSRIDDAPGTVIYLDPPYITKGAKYVHDFADADHGRLAEALRRFKHARVVVSYYSHPRLDELYPGWTMREVEVTKALVNQGQRDRSGSVKATEVLLINQAEMPLFGGTA